MNDIPRKAPTTDPAQILRYRDRQYAAELLAASIAHFDFFTWLNSNPDSSTEAICKQFNFAPRPADVLLTLCRANGFIVTNDSDQHALTQLACEHLVKGSPWNLGPYYAPIQDTPIVQSFLKALTSGKPANWQAQKEGDDWHKSMLSEDFARGFTELMNCRGLALGQALAKSVAPLLGSRSRVLDVGGGPGIYASTLVAAHPQLSATVIEQAPVDAIAREEIKKHGLSDRIDVVTADMFQDPWPEAVDILLLSNVLHDWNFPEVHTLLRKSAETLSPGGLLIIHESFLNDDKTGPLPVAEYSALLMNITQGKCYAPGEYGAILSDLNFEVGPYQDTLADRGFMTAVKK
ncbi:methyltransferase [Verrucomicrobia bacterium]|nr:methyltransferase [Verrucomicrobiota bacterium]